VSIISRRAAFAGSSLLIALPAQAVSPEDSIGQKYADAWNATDPAKLVALFTPDGYYEDVPFGLKKKGSAELRELHKAFHEQVGGLYVKLLATHVANGHGTIEWLFGGKDVGVFKTGKPFELQGVSVIEVRNGLISRNLDYYDAATIMKQVGVLPKA
jgi:steroid delta-isomerase-like uncharacterized protein